MSSTDRRKAFAEGEKQPGVPLQANPSCYQRHGQTLFLRKETEPSLSIGRDMHVRFANKPILDVDRSILDCDCRLAVFCPGEAEMEDGVEASRLVRLEDIGHEVEEPSN